MPHVNLTEIISKMKLENLTPEIDVKGIKITQPDINRPALQLAGYFEHHEPTRVQIIGFVEYSYMEAMPEEKKLEIYHQFSPIPCPVWFTAGNCSRIRCSVRSPLRRKCRF